jgi:hypothetical protein
MTEQTTLYQLAVNQNQSDNVWNKYSAFDSANLCFAKYLDHVRTLDKSYQNHLVISENLSRVHQALRLVYEQGEELVPLDIIDITQTVCAMTEEGIIDILYVDLNPNTVKYVKNLVYGQISK